MRTISFSWQDNVKQYIRLFPVNSCQTIYQSINLIHFKMTKRLKFATIPLGWTIKSYFIEVNYLLECVEQQSSTVTVQGKCYCFIHHFGLYFCFNSFVFVRFQRGLFFLFLSLVTKFSFSFFLGFLFFVVRVLAKGTTGWRAQKRCYETDRTFVTRVDSQSGQISSLTFVHLNVCRN